MDQNLKGDIGMDFESIKDCFSPEDGVAYPLCKGNGSDKCKGCDLYTELDESGYREP